MKTTNFELSKKLTEEGFDNKYSFVKFAEGGCAFVDTNPHSYVYELGGIPSYDLETVLEALPKSITKKGSPLKNDLRIWFDQDKCYIGYQSWEGFLEDATVASENEESLADCAARLLLLL